MATASNLKSSPPTSFDIAFQRLRHLLSKDDARSFASTTMQDVWEATKDIERQLQSRRSLRGFHRIQPLLAGIEKYAGVVEVLCQGTPYLPYIWAPIKLSLQIAQGHISALEKLIDAYAMIGEAMPRFDRLSAAFKDDPEFQHVMGHFYSDILEFHRRAYKFFRRRAWKMIFDSLWKTFNLRFQGILENLRRHRDLIDQEANAINIAESKIWRDDQLSRIRQWREEREEQIQSKEREQLTSQTRVAVAWLNANEDQEDILAKLSKRCGEISCHWALEEKNISSWLRQDRDSVVVWLNGKPGAGKSVICSKIIEYIRDRDDVVVFYFCSHQHISLKLPNEVLRSLATQLLAANTELAPYILETFANNGLRPNKKSLGIILEKLIDSLSSVRIVVDGLDECSQTDHEEIIEDLLKLRGPTTGMCKVLLSSRKVPSISKLLQSKPVFGLDDHSAHVKNMISSYVSTHLSTLHKGFSPDLIEELGRRILAKANGMFLWVRLVMSTLEELCYERDLRDAIESLPEELGPLYERIIARICGEGKSPQQRTAIRILQWILVARRPLKKFEIMSGIALDNRTSSITATSTARGDPLTLCSPLIEVEGGSCGYVKFFHFTVVEYLRGTNPFPLLQPMQAGLTVSLSCVLQLISGLDLIDPDVGDQDARAAVANSFHDLQLYATDHWCDHLLALLSARQCSFPGATELKDLCPVVERLAQRHDYLAFLFGLDTQDLSEIRPSRNNLWNNLGLSSTGRSLVERALRYREKAPEKVGKTIENGLDEHGQSFLLPMSRTRYQSIVEDLLTTHQPREPATSNFIKQHGSEGFLCRYLPCSRAISGFRTTELRQEHEAGHAPRFHCTHPACGFSGWTFKSRAALHKHTTQYHDKDQESPIPDTLCHKSRFLPKEKSLFLLNDRSSLGLSPSSEKKNEMKTDESFTGYLDDPHRGSSVIHQQYMSYPKDQQALTDQHLQVAPSTLPSRPPPDSVPLGWSPQWSSQYSEWYYVNVHTNHSQWQKPSSPIDQTLSSGQPNGPPPNYKSNTPNELSTDLSDSAEANSNFDLDGPRLIAGRKEKSPTGMDFQLQIMLLQRQNFERLITAREEQGDDGGLFRLRRDMETVDARIKLCKMQQDDANSRHLDKNISGGPSNMSPFVQQSPFYGRSPTNPNSGVAAGNNTHLVPTESMSSQNTASPPKNTALIGYEFRLLELYEKKKRALENSH